jgi:hypothetical protein
MLMPMSVLHPTPAPHPIHTVHRVSISVVGLFLLAFGGLGLTRKLDFLSTHGVVIMGLATNGLLALISVPVAAVLIAAGVRGGPTASNVGVVLGALFVVSGLANLFVLSTAMNMLAFRLSNVVFSVVVGTLLLTLGAYGRITGHLPPDSPYYHPAHDAADVDTRTDAERVTDAMLDEELAEAERAVTHHHATPQQLAGVRRASQHRTAAERRAAWRSGL